MNKTEWNTYVAHERARAEPLIARLGFMLDSEQPHLGGERYLMQAISAISGPKLILLGTRISDGERVIIKATSHPAGKKEIDAERRARAALSNLAFSYRRFFAPEEILYAHEGGMTISVQKFIEQDHTFLDRPLKEQFTLALEGLKIQEGAHATTYGHLRRISRIFTLWGASEYLTAARTMAAKAGQSDDALSLLEKKATVIEQYSGFLTHSDFVPHNIRIQNNKLYLLDHASIRFGNKYEGWARFVNFMELHNPPLASALVQYVRDNRTPEESESLRLMRIFRLIEIIAFYTSTLTRTEGDLRRLNEERIRFWRALLSAVIQGSQLPPAVRNDYIIIRDSLRSDEEKARQTGLH